MPQTPGAGIPERTSIDRLWIVVANGGGARILALAPDRSRIELLRDVEDINRQRKTHDLVSDRAGRSFESASAARHAIAPRQDPHEEQKQRFIQSLADLLNEENRAGHFDQLILIVTPAQAKALKDGLDDPTRARVIETLTKDLTKEAPIHVWGRMIEAGMLPARVGSPG